jgi:hypothetical protein
MSRIEHLALKVKFCAPGGTIAELVPVGRYKQPGAKDAR